MSKKRRDKERDSSKIGKVAKVGTAALAIGVGAASFSRVGLSQKLTSEFLPALAASKKTIAKEIREIKSHRSGFDRRIQAKDIKKIYNENIKNNRLLKKELELRHNKPIRIDTSKKADNIFAQLKNIKQVVNNDLSHELRKGYKSLKVKDMINELAEAHSDKSYTSIWELSKDAFAKIKENHTTIKVDGKEKHVFTDFMDKKFAKHGFSKQEQQNFLEYVLKQKDIIEKQASNSKVFDKANEEATQRIFNSMFNNKKYDNTLFGKVNKLAKKAGLDIDSETLFTGGKKLTWKDVKEAYKNNKEMFDEELFTDIIKNNYNKASNKKYETINLMDMMKELEKDFDLDDIIFSKTLKKNIRGDIYSTSETNDIIRKKLDSLATTMPGRLFGGTDIKLRANSPIVTVLEAGTTDINAVYDKGNKSTLLMDAKIALGNASTGKASLYNLTLEDDILKIADEQLASGKIIDNSHGKGARLMKDFIGSNRVPLETNTSLLGELLDIKQDGSPRLATKLKAFFNKGSNDEWERNLLKRTKKLYTDEATLPNKIAELAEDYAAKNGVSIAEARTNVVAGIVSDQKEISALMNDLTASKQINDQTITTLINSGFITDKDSLKILNVLNDKEYSNAADLIKMLSTDASEKNYAKLYNKDLENIINRGYVNTDHITNLQNISQNRTRSFFAISAEYTNVLDAEDVVRREAIKEVMLREASSYSISHEGAALPTREGLSKIERILTESNLNADEVRNLSYVTDWGILQSITKIANDTDAEVNIEKMVGPHGTLTYFDDLLHYNGHMKYRYSSMLEDLGARYSFLDAGPVGNLNQNYFNEYNRYTFMKSSVMSRLDQVEGINDFIKQASQEILASRDKGMSNYTTLTQLPQFFVARLNWGIEAAGLNLSQDSTKSTMDLIKNIGLKRILPVMAAYQLYDYANFESENFTGVSITGAAANTLSNFDIAARKIAYGTGIGQAIDWFKESSVIAEYATGSDEFQDAEERKEWYKNGYQAVRGGRFWGFGSASEFRGGAIQYYQPNYLRRAHSNWKEVGIYGSADEKFKHSWIPSLRHPLSPLRAALDPYWLERKNMDSRPYPLTGKMFSEGTPWGAILNPTVGELLKPVRMLPEVRKRLGNDGRDIRQVVENINNKIKQKANKNDDMIIVNGTDVRTADYVPYGNTGDGYMNISFRDGKAISPGINYMKQESVKKFKHMKVATGEVKGQPDIPNINQNGDFVQEVKGTSYEANTIVTDIIEDINTSIKKLAARFTGYSDNNPAYAQSNLPAKDQGTYVYTNLVAKRNAFNSRFYQQNYDPAMIDKNLASDYLKDGMHSISQLSGIYGFLNDLAFGEDSYTFRYENAGQMTSFSRHFWDAQIGGLGITGINDPLMEIARRFFPSEDKSRINYNPLKNNMPEWLPEKFLTGDAYASLPKGEMRLPGKGYETLHELHPDQFGEYGAFDRMQILGDIAPTSEEYKIWRNIARNTVTDPELIKQMDEIQRRVKKTSSKHEFYDYRFINNNLEQHKGVVKSFEGNIVELVSGEKLKLGGIVLNKDADLSELLTPGQKIHYRTSADVIKRLEDGIITNAVIYKKEGSFGTNINKELVDMGMATRDKDDTSAIGYIANTGSIQQTLGGIQELIAHADIPFLHNKYMKIETARESFRREQVYGTSFSTWDHPIKAFVNPALNKTFGQGLFRHSLAVGSTALYFGLSHVKDLNPLYKYGAGALMAGLNPSALLGMGAEFGLNLGMKAIGGGSNLLNVERGAKWGSIIGTVGWGLANAENPFKAMSSFAIAGEIASKYLKVDEVFDNWGHGKGALVGAGIGLAISAIKNPKFTKEMFRREWIPKETEKKYELDEYFDRLEYIKYKGLYNQARARAFLLEGNINIKHIFKKLDKNKKKIAKLTRKAEKLSNKYSAGGYEYEQEMEKINSKIMSLQNSQTAFRGGKYTKAAIAYHKAMESTIYGLKEGATQDEILSSIPVQYKDHFVAFMNERSEKERKKILRQVPEYLRKPLELAWGRKPHKVDSNRKFFKKHAMPGMAWRGWKPNVNLKYVKMKTIQNEGMLLSDFGYYESEKSKMEYHMAPDIHNYDKGQGTLSYLSNMTAALSGLGMSVQNISVEPSSAPGLWIAADVKQTTKDVKKIGSYAVNSGVQTLTSLLF